MTRQLLLIEPNSSGHRLMYVRTLVEAAHTRGSDVTVVLHADQRADPALEMHLGSVQSDCIINFAQDFSLNGIETLSRDHHADATVVPDGDRTAMAVARRGAWNGHGELTTLIMRPYAQRSRIPGVRSLKHSAKKLLLRRANGIDGVRVVLLDSGLAISHQHGRGLTSAPDPITMSATSEDASALRATLDITANRYWFGVLGAVTPRKNLPLISESLSMSAPSRTGLLIAGVCDDGTLAAAHSALQLYCDRGGRVIVVNRLLSENELDSAVRAVDCVVLAHSNEGASGLFGKALAAGTRVLAAGATSLRRDVAAVGDHAAWCELRPRSLSSALTRSLSSSRPEPYVTPNAAGFARALLD